MAGWVGSVFPGWRGVSYVWGSVLPDQSEITAVRCVCFPVMGMLLVWELSVPRSGDYWFRGSEFPGSGESGRLLMWGECVSRSGYGEVTGAGEVCSQVGGGVTGVRGRVFPCLACIGCRFPKSYGLGKETLVNVGPLGLVKSYKTSRNKCLDSDRSHG